MINTTVMKKKFETRAEAIEWLAVHCENEAHFEILREELNYHFIYHNEYSVDFRPMEFEVVWLSDDDQ